MLATNQTTLKALMDQSCSLFRRTNKNIAYFLFMAHSYLVKNSSDDADATKYNGLDILSYGPKKFYPTRCPGLDNLVWPKISASYNRAYRLIDKSKFESKKAITPLYRSWVTQNYPPGKYECIFTEPEPIKNGDILLADENLDHEELQPMKDFSWSFPPSSYNIYLFEPEDPQVRTLKLVRLNDDLICCNSNTDASKIDQLVTALTKNIQTVGAQHYTKPQRLRRRYIRSIRARRRRTRLGP